MGVDYSIKSIDIKMFPKMFPKIVWIDLALKLWKTGLDFFQDISFLTNLLDLDTTIEYFEMERYILDIYSWFRIGTVQCQGYIWCIYLYVMVKFYKNKIVYQTRCANFVFCDSSTCTHTIISYK